MHTKEEEKSQINNLSSHLKNLLKEQNNPKARKRKEIIKIESGINKIENKKTEKNQ